MSQGTGNPRTIRRAHAETMEEIRERKDVILFIDEIHEIVGAGSAGDGIWMLEIYSETCPFLVANFS